MDFLYSCTPAWGAWIEENTDTTITRVKAVLHPYGVHGLKGNCYIRSARQRCELHPALGAWIEDLGM